MDDVIIRAGTRDARDRDMGAPLAVAFREWNGLLEALPVGVCVCDLDGTVIHANARAAELWGPEPAAKDRGLLDGLLLHEALSSGVALRDRPTAVVRPDGTRVEVVAGVQPLRDDAGGLIGALYAFQEMKRPAPRPIDAWIRSVVERSPVAIYTTDAAGRVTSFNEAAERLWGRAPVLGQDMWCGSHRLEWPDGRPMPLNACPMATALTSGEAAHGQEAVYERPDGARGAFLAYPTVLHDAQGRVAGAVNMLVDISDRKQAEDRQKVLVDELNHRVKNTLASVQSLAAHSLRGAAPPQDMRERFEARLMALSNAHNQLADRRWQDADLRAIAGEVLAPYRADHRVSLEGQAMMVSARTAVTLSLVLHELATNAVRYGALSAGGGRLTLAWGLGDPGILVVDWRETGGPAVAKPVRRGFGTRFIEGSVTGELGGRITHDFDPAGVRCRLEIPR